MFPGGMWTNMPNNNGYRADHDVDEQTNFAEFTVTEHLDRYDFDVGILTGQDLYRLPATTNLDYAAALCRAYNDWTLEHWIATDERFRMILTVGPNDPIQAVQEIDRLGGHPAVVGVMFPAGGRYPYGNRMYHPIYEAAERHGLVMVTHFGGEGVGANNAPTAAGYPTYYLEMRMARPQIAQAHVTSLICEGVFEKYTDLNGCLWKSTPGGFPDCWTTSMLTGRRYVITLRGLSSSQASTSENIFGWALNLGAASEAGGSPSIL